MKYIGMRDTFKKLWFFYVSETLDHVYYATLVDNEESALEQSIIFPVRINVVDLEHAKYQGVNT